MRIVQVESNFKNTLASFFVWCALAVPSVTYAGGDKDLPEQFARLASTAYEAPDRELSGTNSHHALLIEEMRREIEALKQQVASNSNAPSVPSSTSLAQTTEVESNQSASVQPASEESNEEQTSSSDSQDSALGGDKIDRRDIRGDFKGMGGTFKFDALADANIKVTNLTTTDKSLAFGMQIQVLCSGIDAQFCSFLADKNIKINETGMVPNQGVTTRVTVENQSDFPSVTQIREAVRSELAQYPRETFSALNMNTSFVSWLKTFGGSRSIHQFCEILANSAFYDNDRLHYLSELTSELVSTLLSERKNNEEA